MKLAASALSSCDTLRIPVEANHHQSAVGALIQRIAALSRSLQNAPR